MMSQKQTNSKTKNQITNKVTSKHMND